MTSNPARACLLGPQLQRSLGSKLREAVASARSLRTVITTGSAADVRAILSDRLPADRATFAALKRRWVKPEVRAAAWQDFLAGCRDETTGVDVLAQRRDQFWHLVRAAEYDLRRLSLLLAGVLADQAFPVIDARLWLGEITDEEFTLPNPPDQAAGLTEAQRLDLCERVLTREPIQAHRVIWFAFDRAGPGTGLQELGAVQFWEGQLLSSVLEIRDGPYWDQGDLQSRFRR